MGGDDDFDAPLRIECTECNFATVVRSGDDVSATEVIIRHGRETGHRLTPRRLDGEDRP